MQTDGLLLSGDEEHFGETNDMVASGGGYNWSGIYATDGSFDICSDTQCSFTGYWEAEADTVPVPESPTLAIFAAALSGLMLAGAASQDKRRRAPADTIT
jgi:hypothetical protein